QPNNSTDWEMVETNTDAHIYVPSGGDFVFTLSLGTDHIRLSAEYPLLANDYHVLHTGRINTAGSDTHWHESRPIRHLTGNNKTQKDTVCFFIDKDNKGTLKLQYCTNPASNEGKGAWSDVTSPSTASISLNGITKTGYYNFEVLQTTDGSGNRTVSGSLIGEYEGNFYIRTDCATGGWEAYKSAADNVMVYSEVAKESGYDHYHCHWVEKNQNIKFTIANDYSPCITDTLARETGVSNISNYIDGYGKLTSRDANVRFMWNSETNVIDRRYIDGANDQDNNFLVLLPKTNAMIYNAQTGGTAYNTTTGVKFTDNGNWIYESDVFAEADTYIKLRATYGTSPNEVVQWFKGAASGDNEHVQLIHGSSGTRYPIRIVYDFKTNRLVTAWVIPAGNITGDQTINSDVMFIREHQGNVSQITFADNKSLSQIKTAYGVIRFNRWTLNNRAHPEDIDHDNHGKTDDQISTYHAALPTDDANYKGRYERGLYYISFPFEVNMSEVFGFGTYPNEWDIQYYDGAARASEGFWADTKGFWKTLDKTTGVLKKGVGYLLRLDLEALALNSTIWKNTDQVEIYFPSKGDLGTMSKQDVEVEVPSHQCNIGPRFEGGDDRRFKDSHWNMVGVPTYVNDNPELGWSATEQNWQIGEHFDDETATSIGYSDNNPLFYYAWNMSDNKLYPTAVAGATYRSMHAYMMQFYGTVTFANASGSTPSAVAARRRAGYKGSYNFTLELQQNGAMLDQTIINLNDNERATTAFDVNLDMSKEIRTAKQNGNVVKLDNIYTLVTSVINDTVTVNEVAGNCLPLELEQVTTIPVGVVAKTNGEYTFAMPDGTDGLSVTLLDSETGVHTDMSVEDYTVELTAGTYENRFYLSIDPRNAATLIDEAGNPNDDVRTAKILKNGLLYIQRGERIYDATGREIE
ncbi:MAG: hypothetical protein J5612_01855, partial [Paludibacteraceae bacterium]|nr:hypothetical protein [Paludibacteraceae bacterium]